MDNEMKLGGTVSAVPLTLTIDYLGLRLGPPILGNYRSGLKDLEFSSGFRAGVRESFVLMVSTLSQQQDSTQGMHQIRAHLASVGLPLVGDRSSVSANLIPATVV